jgi:hypothetical protein
MATIKKAPKAQLGKLLRKGAKELAEKAVPKIEKKIVIPEGLQRSLNKSKSGPAKLKAVGSSEAERIAFGKKTNLQENPYSNPTYEKSSFIERDVKKSKPKTDKYGFDVRPDRNGGTHKKKMKNGGSLTGLKASNKRVGPVDPNGAYTKVQKKTLAGAKGKASLTKDKQLGATKMAKCGAKMSKKK